MRREEPALDGAGVWDPGGKAARVFAALAGLGILAGLGYSALAARGTGPDPDPANTATVRRGNLTLTVVAGGDLQAMESLRLRNEAMVPTDPESGWRRAIAYIVEEGTVVTEQDVGDGMVLARMESADLEDRESQMRIWFHTSEAAYAGARGDCEIQRKRNESHMARAGLAVKFSRMELGRYLGADLAARLLAEEAGLADLPDASDLGGAARRDLRGYVAQVELAAVELSQAEEALDWSKQLHERGWISGTELTADEVSVSRRTRELTAAEEELRLFKRYTLPKESRQRLSDYMECMRELARAEARARSRLAQAEADLRAKRARYELTRRRLQDLTDSIEKCTIRTPIAGRVIYASTADPWRRENEPVQEGQTLWPMQSIILIPDLSTLAARVTVHETDIGRIELGQRALVSVEALPGTEFTARVARVGSVASLAQAYTNPELRVYEVDVALDQPSDALTPGMSATAEIVVARLDGALLVPVEAVVTRDGHRFCSVARPSGTELRRIDTGHVSEHFAEVRGGLTEGETVYLSTAAELLDGGGRDSRAEPVPTFRVERGDFTVGVPAEGSVYSVKPLELKSEVEGWRPLLRVVEEGTAVTEEDVEGGTVLAEFDPSALREQESEQLAKLYEAEAAYSRAREDHRIQQWQNESDTALAELALDFARMELERYLGSDLADQALRVGVDFAGLASHPTLGGTARQALRNYESRTELAAEELLRAEERLRSSRELHERGYASLSELKEDELRVSRWTLQLETAREESRLFRRYSLPEWAEQRYSDCVSLERDLARIEAQAASRLAQAEAQVRSTEAVHELAGKALDRTRRNIEKCTIRAVRPGQVVYGSRSDPVWYRTGDSAIRPGTMIQENRTVVRIPDTSGLAAFVDVREADIAKVEVGQPVAITIDAVPGATFAGRVAAVRPMADSEGAWVNPEGKVYKTEVAFEEAPERFIPGMSAAVEIIAARLEDVLYVPACAVTSDAGSSLCWVSGAAGPQPRRIETGLRSDTLVEVKDGLAVGEEVYLVPPRDVP